MQETINCKLNYLDQYFVDLLPGRRLAKDAGHFVAAVNLELDD